MNVSDEKFLVLAACVWLAPHVPKQSALIGANLMLITAAIIGLGWL